MLVFSLSALTIAQIATTTRFFHILAAQDLTTGMKTKHSCVYVAQSSTKERTLTTTYKACSVPKKLPLF